MKQMKVTITDTHIVVENCDSLPAVMFRIKNAFAIMGISIDYMEITNDDNAEDSMVFTVIDTDLDDKNE